MPAPSVTNTFVNGTTASATDVNQNFTDIINALTDGLKDITISSLSTVTSTHSGTATFNGNVVLGNASTDTVTLTATLTSSTAINITKTTNQLVLGTTNTTTINSIAPTASRVYTIPDAGAAASFVMTQGTQTIAGALTLSSTLAVSGTISCVDITSTGSINSLNMTTTNYIMNGNFDFWQRSTSISVTASGYYAPDRIRIGNPSDGRFTMSREDTVLPTVGSNFNGASYCVKMDCTTAATAVDTVCMFSQYVEGNVYKHLHSKQVTLSFWIRSTKTGTSCVVFNNSDGTRCYVAEYTINSADTWEKKIITLTLDNSGTWLFDNGNGLRVGFTLYKYAGYREQSAGSWATTAAVSYGTSNQVNLLDNTANNIYISQVQLELGDQATPFKPFGGSYTSDLTACLRYCWAPAGTNQNSAVTLAQYRLAAYTTNDVFFYLPTPVPMRGGVSVANTTEATHWQIYTVAVAAQTGFAYSSLSQGDGMVGLAFTKTTHGLTDATLRLIGASTPFVITSEL